MEKFSSGLLLPGLTAGVVAGGAHALSNTDEPARIAGGVVGGGLGGATASALLSKLSNTAIGNILLKMPPPAVAKTLNLLLATGSGLIGSRLGENTASVIKNNIVKKGSATYKQAIGSNMNTFTPQELLNFVKNMNS